jgi:multidrug efflux pump subunit AcrB
MKFSQFFFTRPIFAAVLSLLILIAGAISLFQLPISEYPEVVPPTVVVRANFPGANPKVIGETVAAPLEQAITGVENMLYMSSQSTADGKMTLTITFALGTDLDNAQVQVQNRVTRTEPKLPEEVTRIGITVDKASPDLTLVVHLTSPDKRYDMLYLSNYAILNIKDELSRLDGVGDVKLFGMGDYSLRVWLDPNKTASRNLTATDVVNAVREQNRQVAAGQLGAPPAPECPPASRCRSTLRAVWSARKSSKTSSSAQATMARSPASKTSPGLNWAPVNTPCARCWTIRKRWPCRSSSARAPTPSTSPNEVRGEDGRAEEKLPGRHGLQHRL